MPAYRSRAHHHPWVWQPAGTRQWQVSTGLKAYAAMADSASCGTVRDVGTLGRR